VSNAPVKNYLNTVTKIITFKLEILFLSFSNVIISLHKKSFESRPRLPVVDETQVADTRPRDFRNS